MGQGRSVGTADIIRPSGVPAGVRDDIVADEIEDLLVPLVQVARAVARHTQEGDPVTVALGAETMPVAAPAGVLGHIPPNYRRRVRAASADAGHVISISLDPLSCTVLLRAAET